MVILVLSELIAFAAPEFSVVPVGGGNCRSYISSSNNVTFIVVISNSIGSSIIIVRRSSSGSSRITVSSRMNNTGIIISGIKGCSISISRTSESSIGNTVSGVVSVLVVL